MTEREFWDQIAEKYAARPVDDPDAYARKLEQTREVMPEGAEVFEFGCGTGTTALWHAPHAGHVTAIDISSEMIRIARGKAEEAGIGNVQFEEGRIEDFDAGPESFDMVMAHSILHLIPDPEAALSKSYRLLKPGGHFVTSTVTMQDGLWFLRPVIAVMRRTGNAPRVWFLSHSGLRAMIEAAGFEIVTDWGRRPRQAAFFIARKPVRD